MLTSKQRAHLRGLGNTLDPIIQLGKGGLGDMVLRQTDEALTARELVKGRVLKNSELEPDEAAEALARATKGELVQVVGRVFLLYRPNPEKPRITLPE
jgi:RNA-binding protein